MTIKFGKKFLIYSVAIILVSVGMIIFTFELETIAAIHAVGLACLVLGGYVVTFVPNEIKFTYEILSEEEPESLTRQLKYKDLSKETQVEYDNLILKNTELAEKMDTFVSENNIDVYEFIERVALMESTQKNEGDFYE